MSSELSNSAQCYGLYDKDKIVGFIGVIHFPHPKNDRIKHISRLVILPEYQGIGLGTRFLSSVSQLYNEYDVMIVTSSRNLIHALHKNNDWITKRYSRTTKSSGVLKNNKSERYHVKTATFKYKGGNDNGI